MINKTPKMLQVEERLGQSLEVAVLAAYKETGSLLSTAKKLGIPYNTLWYWCVKLGFELKTVLTRGSR